ncbi:MAG: VWA domain-containing protein [Bacteroidales bacterium]|nr:VWA domain-containing protein [Bacteroidales bacterium]
MFFEYPKLLWLLLLVPLAVLIYVWRELKGRHPYITVSNITPWKMGKDGLLKRVARHIPFVLRCVALAALVLAIARPRSASELEKVSTEGIDIVLGIDVSTSMLAMDFKPDRINAAKQIAIEFVAQRPADRMGVVVFAGESYTQCPLTTDRQTLINMMKDISCGIIDDGTAIGNGIATAVARLKESDAKSRVVILLTDGVNNTGEISPQMAAEIAKTYGVRIYTIGIGAMGEAPYPTEYGVQMVKVDIDEPLMKQIAQETGGKYFRATDNTKLAEIYAEINKMEKTRTIVDSYPQYKELFMRFAVLAFAAILLEVLMRLFTRHLPD